MHLPRGSLRKGRYRGRSLVSQEHRPIPAGRVEVAGDPEDVCGVHWPGIPGEVEWLRTGHRQSRRDEVFFRFAGWTSANPQRRVTWACTPPTDPSGGSSRPGADASGVTCQFCDSQPWGPQHHMAQAVGAGGGSPRRSPRTNIKTILPSPCDTTRRNILEILPLSSSGVRRVPNTSWLILQ